MDESSIQAMDKGTPDISIVIPVYNEDQTIEAVLRMIAGVDFGDYRQEVVVVDDGSKDKTRELLKKFPNTRNLRIIYREVNGGRGAAVRDGLALPPVK